MIIAVIIIFSFTLGIKIILLRHLKILREKYPEKKDYYDTRIKLAKMLIVPPMVMIVATFIFVLWKNVAT